MKVLHVSTGYPLSFHGGITNYVRALIQAQLGLGIEVYVMGGPDQSPLPEKVHYLTHDSKVTRPFSFKSINNDPSSRKAVSLIKEEKFDLIHFHMALDFDFRFFDEISILGVPYIVSLHDYFYLCPRITMVDYKGGVCREVNLEKCSTCVGLLDQVETLRRVSNRFNLPLPRVKSDTTARRLNIMRGFLENAELLLPVSTRVQEIYSSVCPEGRYRVEHIGNESAVGAKVSKVRSNKIRATFMGTLSYIKGADVLFNLITSVERTDIEFHIFARMNPDYERKLAKAGAIIHGPYRTNDIPTIMSQTDLGLVLPIWEDNGPQVLMEFLNYRVPVLATRRGGIPDFVSSDCAVLFDPADERELHRASKWLDNVKPSELEKMGELTPPLLTPLEHASRIVSLYGEV